MPSTYTTSLKLTLPATGELSGTWGTTVNTGITTLVDDAVAGTAAITVGGSDYTLSNTDGAANEARKMFITATGSPGAARNVIVPAVSKLYFVFNNTTGGFALTFKTLAGTGISVANGARMVLYCDGTNVVNALNAITLASPLPATSGGTGQSSYTAGDLLYASGTTALSKLGVGTADQVLTSSGTAPQWSSGLTLTTLTASGTVSFTGGTVTLGSSTGASTLGLGTGATLSGQTKTINIGTAGVSGSTTNINIGSAVSGSTTSIIFNSGGAEAGRFSGGSFGVGTSSPAYKLDVFDGVVSVRRSDNTSAERYAFQLLRGNGTGTSAVLATIGDASNGVAALTFNMGPVGAATERMRLDSSGNLGVGTSSPAQLIDAVRSHNAGTSITVRNANTGASANVQFIANADTTVGRFTVFSSGAAAGLANAVSIEQSTNNPILFYTNSSEKVRITGSGDVGIGTNNPVAKVDVSGNVRISSGSAYYWGNATTQIVGTDGGPLQFVVGNGGEKARITAGGELLIGTTTSDGSRLRVYGSYQTLGDGTYEGLIGKASSLVSGGGAGDFAVRSAANLVFATNGNTERARIDSSGNFIHQVNGTAPTLTTNSTMSFELTSNTSLKIVVRGSDGTTRSTTLTLS